MNELIKIFRIIDIAHRHGLNQTNKFVKPDDILILETGDYVEKVDLKSI